MHEILCPWFQYMNLLQFFFKEELALKVFIWERKNKDISVKTHTFARPLCIMHIHHLTFYGPSQYLSSFPSNGPKSINFRFSLISLSVRKKSIGLVYALANNLENTVDTIDTFNNVNNGGNFGNVDKLTNVDNVDVLDNVGNDGNVCNYWQCTMCCLGSMFSFQLNKLGQIYVEWYNKT